MHTMAAERLGTATQAPDETLVMAARAGDRSAFSLLVDRYRGIVFAYACARMREREEAEDVAQDVFARAYASLPRLRGSGAWQPWLLQILRNQCRDALRRRRVRRTEPLDVAWLEGGPSPEARVLGDEGRRELLAAVAALPESLRIPLLMHVAS